MKLHQDKFAELLLYIAKKCENDPHFGGTKLNKILFFSDFFAFRRWQKSITGATYQRLDRGPAPKCLLPVQKELIRNKSLAVQEVVRYAFSQKRPIALREANLAIFSAAEIALVDDVIDQLRNSTAAEVSEFSHGFWWQIARDREEIPIQVAVVQFPDEVSAEEQRHAQSLEQRALAISAA